MLKLPQPTMKPANPVFRFEMARGRGLVQPQQLRSYSRWVFGIAVGVVVLLWSALLIQQFSTAQQIITNPNSSPPLYPYIHSAYDEATSDTLIIMGIGSILVSLIADGWYMTATVTNINRKISSGHWDLLELTPLSRDAILEGVFAAAEIRAWSAMIVDMAARIALIAFAVMSVLLPSYWIIEILHGDNPPYPIFAWFTQNLNSAVAPVVLLVGTTILGNGYILEPLWRMRVMLTTGLAVSARFHSESMAAVAGAVALLAIRLTQAGLLATSLYAFVRLNQMFLDAFVKAAAPIFLWGLFALGFPIGCSMIVAVNRRYYNWLRVNAYDRLWTWAFRIE